MRFLLQLQFAQVVVRPAVRKVAHGRGRPNLLGRPQAVEKNLPLQIPLAEVSESESERVRDKEGARRFDQSGDFPDEGE